MLSLVLQFAVLVPGPTTISKPFIVAELFTSEGCSSCPPADQLLSEIVDSQYDDIEVMALSFHVDYWDYIGWKDPYADARFGDRQRSYAQKLQSRQVYTPQLVLNGKEAFVGSNRAQWQRALKQLRSDQPKATLDLTALVVENGVVSAAFSGTDETGLILNFAVVERNLSQQVTRGENRGRRLQHDNVVRYFEQRTFDGRQSLKAKVPKDIKWEDAKVIAYLQRTSTYEIVAATQDVLP
ncbi:MAG: DUF1223 domain-containing protein [Bacteroidota bacterium]